LTRQLPEIRSARRSNREQQTTSMIQSAMHTRLQASLARSRGGLWRASRPRPSGVMVHGLSYHSGRVLSSEQPIKVREKWPANYPEEMKEKYYARIKAQEAAADYNERRKAYNEQVKILRKKYFEEVQQHKKEDQEGKDKKQQILTRARLERMRQRNIRSGKNAILQEQLRLEQAQKFAEHVAQEQIKRDERNELMRQAHQLAIDELEKEAPLWLMSPEEVEAAFTPEAEQLLWARPGGVIGAPNPSPDAQFWQHETHTWQMTKTYKLQRELLLEDLQQEIYDDANLDPEFWTPERMAKTIELEEKARLRADVERVGRRELLRKQQRMIEEQFTTEPGEIPKAKPPPDLKFLANQEALQLEGASVLMEDPTKFFVFDENAKEEDDPSLLDFEENADANADKKYRGPTLGRPIGLKKIGKKNFPLMVGKLPPEDKRSDREKKQAEREERLLMAAREKQAAEMSVDLAAENKSIDDLEPDVDYDTFDYHDEEDKEWMKGLDPDDPEDRDLIENSSPLHRYTDGDIEWVKDKLREQAEYEDTVLRMDVETVQQTNLYNRDIFTDDLEVEDEDGDDGSGESPERKYVFDDAVSLEENLERAVYSLPYPQVSALSDLDDAFVESNGTMTDEEIAKAAEDIPHISVEHIKLILNRDRDYKTSG